MIGCPIISGSEGLQGFFLLHSGVPISVYGHVETNMSGRGGVWLAGDVVWLAKVLGW